MRDSRHSFTVDETGYVPWLVEKNEASEGVMPTIRDNSEGVMTLMEFEAGTDCLEGIVQGCCSSQRKSSKSKEEVSPWTQDNRAGIHGNLHVDPYNVSVSLGGL